MPYRRRSPSKYRWFPGWLIRDGYDLARLKEGKTVGPNFSVPKGARRFG